VPRASSLILLLWGTALAGCSDSYKFEENSVPNETADWAAPMSIDNGVANASDNECNSECQADGQSSSGA
jgi:hypothetical protein